MPEQSTFKTSVSSFINPQISKEGNVAYSETRDGRTHFLLTDLPRAGITLADAGEGYSNIVLANDGQEIVKRSVKASETGQAPTFYPRGNSGAQDINISTTEDFRVELTGGNKIFNPTKYEVTIAPEAKNVVIVNNTAGNTAELTSKAVIKIPVVKSEEPFFSVKFDDKLTHAANLSKSHESGIVTKMGNTQILIPVYAQSDPRSNAEFKVELYDPKDSSKTSTLTFRGGIPVATETNEAIFKVNDTVELSKKELTAAYQQALENQATKGGFEIKKTSPALALNLEEAISQARGLQESGVRLSGDNNKSPSVPFETQVQKIKESAGSQPLSVEAVSTIDSSVVPNAKPVERTQTNDR